MELSDAVRRRRMVRAFTEAPVDPATVDHLVDLARRAPSAGHSQGWAFVVLEGEERAWGRRLAKRFGIENGNYDDRTFTAVGDGTFPCVLDHGSLKPEGISKDIRAFFEPLDIARGDSLITFGWAMAADLA